MHKPKQKPMLKLAVLAMIMGIPLLSGCGKLRSHRGYVVDPVLTASMSPGVDNKRSVEAVMGRPTFVGQFDDKDWYYVSRDTRQLAFARPRATQQLVLRVRFDEQGNVSAVDRSGVELVQKISPDGDKTPTLGRQRGFFEDLFGNIGRVGAPGVGGAGSPTGP